MASGRLSVPRFDDSDYRHALQVSKSETGSGFVVLDTLGRLKEHDHRLIGHCMACARLYRRDRRDNPSSSFAIDLTALIAERGPDCRVVGLRPVRCVYCGSLETTFQLAVPPKGGWRD
jgi:hypothetical protein